MSGLVTGLQNRVQRFESASDLQHESLTGNVPASDLFLCAPRESPWPGKQYVWAWNSG